jgi:hypothetical protein
MHDSRLGVDLLPTSQFLGVTSPNRLHVSGATDSPRVKHKQRCHDNISNKALVIACSRAFPGKIINEGAPKFRSQIEDNSSHLLFIEQPGDVLLVYTSTVLTITTEKQGAEHHFDRSAFLEILTVQQGDEGPGQLLPEHSSTC